MPTSVHAQSQGQSHQIAPPPPFRKIPEFILRARRFIPELSSYSRISVLSVIYYESLGRLGCCTSRGSRIAQRSGIGRHPQFLHRILRDLEKAGTIRREGNGKASKIFFILPIPEDYDPNKDLIIPPAIFNHPKLTLTQKFIATVVRITCAEGDAWHWWCKKISMDEQTFKWNLRQIILKLHPKPCTILHGNPILFYKQPYTILSALLESRDSVGLLPRGSNNRWSATTDINYPVLNGGDKMIPETISHDQYRTFSSSPSSQSRPTKECPEIETVWKALPNTVAHALGSKAYEDAKKTINQLRFSPRKGLSAGQVDKLTHTMMNPVNGGRKYTKRNIDQFLDHKFTPTERAELYKRLSQYYDKAYRPKAKGHANLATALCNINGWSLMMEVWYNPPKPVRIAYRTLSPNLEQVVDMVVEVLPRHSYNLSQVKANIKNLDMWHRKIIYPKMSEDARYHYGSFLTYMRGFIDFAMEKQNGNFRACAGWFKASSKIHSDWLRAIKQMTYSEENDTSDYLLMCQA